MQDQRAAERAAQARFAAERAEAEARLNVATLVGLTDEQAQRAVTEAGGVYQSYDADDPNVMFTLDLHLNRVRAALRTGRVVKAYLG